MNKFTQSACAAALLAMSIATAATACADDPNQVGNGNVEQNGGGIAEGNGANSISVTTINGVTTVMVDGRQVFGAEAARYINAAKARSQGR